MTTRYAVKVTCDEQRSNNCHGLLLFEGGRSLLTENVQRRLEARGWWRGYTAERSHDVCPACQEHTTGERAAEPTPARGARG